MHNTERLLEVLESNNRINGSKTTICLSRIQLTMRFQRSEPMTFIYSNSGQGHASAKRGTVTHDLRLSTDKENTYENADRPAG